MARHIPKHSKASMWRLSFKIKPRFGLRLGVNLGRCLGRRLGFVGNLIERESSGAGLMEAGGRYSRAEVEPDGVRWTTAQAKDQKR